MRVKLTPAFVATPPRVSQRVTYWDAALPSFGFMVTPNRHQSFVVQYRTGGRSKRMHLKNGLTLSEARKEAKAVVGALPRVGTRSPSAVRPSAPKATR